MADSIANSYPDVWQPPYTATWDIRDDHPVLYSGNMNGLLVGQAAISPFISTVGNQIFVYSGLDLGLPSSNFTLGWTIDCANDVIYEKVSAPVPEPATLLLLGSGLLGLASFRRKRNR
jgi:hypothetical protein